MAIKTQIVQPNPGMGGDILPLPGETAEQYASRMQKMGITSGSMQPLPGETLNDFRNRMVSNTTGDLVTNPGNIEDTYRLHQLQQDEEAKSRGILGEQTTIASKRLNDLASLLAKQQKTQFNEDIPGLAETAQGQGFLETSGFGNSLASRYKELSAKTSAEIAKQALADRDLEIGGLGKIGENANALATGGLQRTFSTEDLTRSEALARELAKYGVPAPAKQPSTSDKLLQYSGPILSGVGAVKGAA